MPVEIKLGDVIRVYRSDKSEEEWYVSYLDSNEIQLINDTKELTLQIENGSFVDRTIKKMMVVACQGNFSLVDDRPSNVKNIPNQGTHCSAACHVCYPLLFCEHGMSSCP